MLFIALNVLCSTELMGLVLKDAQHIQATLQALTHDQSVAEAWASRIMDSAVKTALQVSE